MNKPKRGEIWAVDDLEITMNRKIGTNEKNRYVLIISSSEFLKNNPNDIYTIIPFTTSAKPDLYTLHIPKKHVLSATFTVSDKSHVLLYWTQTIKLLPHHKKVGILDFKIFDDIISQLCINMLGYGSYDLEV